MLPAHSDKIKNTKEFHCDRNALERLPGSFLSLWPDSPCFLISDENTYKVCGDRIKTLLAGGNIPIAGEKCFPGNPVLHGDYRHSIEIISLLKSHAGAVPLVIGSGSLNDIVKRAAFEAEIGYAVVATAASVDGYASDGAALLENGVKHTMACPAPTLIIADTEILTTAPAEMTSAGYGDLLAKYPAGGDWILADLVKLDPIDPLGWSLVHDRLDEWTANPAGLLKGEYKPVVALFEGLTYAGFAMQYMKQSRPVSGAEHLLSHIWEMSGHRHKGQELSHGFQVSAGSVICLRMMHYLVENPMKKEDWARAEESYESPETRREKIPGLFSFLDDQDLLFSINDEKTPDQPGFKERLALLEEKWSLLISLWKEYLPSVESFTKNLVLAGCPVNPGDIGISKKQLYETLVRAQYLRNRYTILDLFYELGFLRENHEFLDSLTG